MKYYLIFAFFLLLNHIPAAALTVDGGRQAGQAPGAPCDSVAETPSAGEMLLFNVSVNGGGSTANVSANDSFTISMDYYLQVCEPPLSDNFCQVVVGYAASPAPQFCIFRSRVDCAGQAGSLSFKMKAPAFPSEYIVAFDLGRTVTEPPCPTTWPQGTPSLGRYIACVNVTAVNLPIPVTGIANNVTPTSAMLHGTVNPAGASTAVHFLYGTGPGLYTDSVAAVESPVSGDSTVAVSGALSGLAANTRYYYRATAVNENGYNTGEEENFFTGAVFTLAEPIHFFGHVPLNGSRTDSVTVLNTGNLNLQVTSVITLSGQYSVAPLSASIVPAGSRKFAVTFSPPAYGIYNSGIVFVHGAGTSPDTQLVRGDAPIGRVSLGWNIVSVPLTVPDPRKTVVFPGAISNAFEFSGGYVARDTVENGLGYWLKYPATDSLVVAGDMRVSETVSVVPGWNMIGGPSYPVPLDSVLAAPPGIIVGNFFEYSSGYTSVTNLRPGKGYWVKVAQAGTITLKGDNLAATGITAPGPTVEGDGTAVILTDASGASHRLHVGISLRGGIMTDELPPPPPDGAFDARFERELGGVGDAEVVLRIRGARYPATLSWMNCGEGATITADGGTAPLDIPGSLRLQGESRVVVRAGGLTGTAGRGAEAFGLTGNYPNPFNPSTMVRFDLPAAGRVRIAVFNAIGEEVVTLVDGVREAGAQSVEFDAADLPGGVYFCRLQGAGRVSTLKMVLLK